MKQFTFLISFLYYFSILIHPISAQLNQNLIFIFGSIHYEGTGEPLKNVEVRIANSYNKPVKSKPDGSFGIGWNCSTYDNKTYLLLCGGAEYCAKILPIGFYYDSDVPHKLRLALMPPKSLEVHVGGYIRDLDGIPIDSVQVFLSDGCTIGFTDSVGHFDIIADKNRLPLKTFLWIEKKEFKRKIEEINYNRSINDTLINNISVEPINKMFNFDFNLTRKDLRSQTIKDVIISINDSIMGITNEEGKFIANDVNLYKIEEFVNIRFSHKDYVERSIKHYLCDDITEIKAPIALEPLERNLEINIFHLTSDGTKKAVKNASVFKNTNTVFYSNEEGKANFSGGTVPKDTLYIRLPQDMFYVTKDTFIVIEEDINMYDLTIKRKSVRIEIFAINDSTGDPVNEIDKLELSINGRKEYIKKRGNSFLLESESLMPDDEIEIRAITESYYHDPIKIKINADLTSYSKFISLRKILYGNFYVNSEPDSALIFIDDKATNKFTPAILEDIPGGMHRLKLEKEGYEAVETLINIEPNKTIPKKFELQKLKKDLTRQKTFQLNTEFGLSGWIFQYIHGDNRKWPIPSVCPKLGINVFFAPLSPILLRGSYFKGYFYLPNRFDFNINEVELACIARLGKYSLHIIPRYTYLRSWEEVLAKFDGYSLDVKISRNIGLVTNWRFLPTLDNYTASFELGFERSYFKPINKSFTDDFEKENQIYLGCNARWKNKWIITYRFGYAFPETKALDEDKKDLVKLKYLIRMHLTFSYFIF